MCLEVENLFNKKNVILSREDVFMVAQYAIKENIIDINFDVPIDEDFMRGVYENKKLHELTVLGALCKHYNITADDLAIMFKQREMLLDMMESDNFERSGG